MAETTVVHLKIRKGAVVQSCDVYIGRPMYQGGWRLPGSRWANPFRIGADGGRAQVLEKYEAHVRASPALMAALPELRGKRLGCWCVEARCLACRGPRGACSHASCHGDVLVKLLGEAAAVAPGEASGQAATVATVATVAAAAMPPDDDDPFWAELGL